MRWKSEENLDDFISQMTLMEKVGQLNQHLYGWQVFKKKNNGDYELTQLFKDHIHQYGGVGAIYGILRADPWSGMNEAVGVSKDDSLKVIKMVQTYIQENTRLKIPAFISEECVHGHQGLHSMMYPANISMGMSWNPSLLKQICQEVSQEIAKKGVNLALFSALDVMRDPRWGRSEECFSEDPYLTAEMAKAAVEGFQCEKDNQVAVVLKHLCAQGVAQGGHNSGAASIGPRELREIFLPPVEAGVKAGAKAVMAAYNEIDGIPCHVNRYLLHDILRKEYGFDGIVMADGCALDRLTTLQPDVAKVAARANQAGVDLSLWDHVYTHLDEAVEKGYLDEKILNKSVKRILKLKDELGLFDDKQIKNRISKEKELALQAARECQVLLKNNGILPLKGKKKIAVIGPNANTYMNMLGDYTSFQKEESVTTVYQGLRELVSKDVEVRYALGCQVRNCSTQYLQEAIALAKDSDVVVLVLGGSSARHFKAEFESNGAVKTSYDKDEMNCGENVDMACLDLDGIQVRLVDEIYQVNKKIIVVLIQGRPHSIENIVDKTQAILAAWYPGNLGGIAIAETLLGYNNPSGRLAMSIPRSSMQLPCYYNGKDSHAKKDYADMPGKALYPFGYGLSYSCFCYHHIRLSQTQFTIEQLQKKGLDITLEVINESQQGGYEVVQVYTVDNESSICRRYKELKAFWKGWVPANSSKKVTLHLKKDAFEIWDESMNRVIESGTVDILIARNSEDYVRQTITII